MIEAAGSYSRRPLQWSDLVLAYLDPVSWFAGLQIGGAGAAWVYARVRRVFRRDRRPQGRESSNINRVTVEDAIDLLTKAGEPARLVVLLEGARDWPYLAQVMQIIDRARAVGNRGLDLWFVSKSPIADEHLADMQSALFLVDAIPDTDWLRIAGRLRADVALTTVTDLGNRYFPKSQHARYFYIFHSLVSTHAAYAEGAFDAYDVIFCTGPAQRAELQARNARLGMARREIVECGYPFVEFLGSRVGAGNPLGGTVLIAPSWFSDDCYETVWLTTARMLLENGWQVRVRPHPESLKRSAKLMNDTERALLALGGIFDRTAAEGRVYDAADVMITDWSGAALEFASVGGNVVFIDTPPKLRNDTWTQETFPLLEKEARGILGPVLAQSELHELVPLLQERRSFANDEPIREAFIDKMIRRSGSASDMAADRIFSALGVRA